jgi:hypothetical protein
MFNRSIHLLLSLIAIATSLSACIHQQTQITEATPSPQPEPNAPTSNPTPIRTPAPTPSPSPTQPQRRVKVFFPKTPQSNENFSYVEPVWRNLNSSGVAQFAIAQLIAGPTPQEQQLGLTRVIQLKDRSNCGSDFQISITEKVAQLQFCRTVVSGGIGDDARITSAIEATLKQFPTVDSVVILDRNGNCLGDGSGENLCLKQGKNPQQLTENSQLALTSIGPVRVGMTVEEASQAAGTKLVQQGSGGEEYGCFYYIPESGPKDLSFMVTEGRIARIDVNSKKMATLSGVKIGDTEARIRELYGGQIEEKPHEYVPGGKYLIFVPQDSSESNYRVIFETNEKGIVTTFRSGKMPEVRQIEGCL